METLCLSMSLCGYVHLNAVALRSQKRAVDPLELEPQVILARCGGREPNSGPLQRQETFFPEPSL